MTTTHPNGTRAPTTRAVGDAWLTQVRADPLYRRLWHHTHSPERVTAAGFFADGLDAHQRIDHNLPTLPVDRLDPAGGAVVVTTGGFAPLHDGHVAMLETAAAALRTRGVRVAGGYVCCDHDGYATTKPHAATWDAERRLRAAAERLDGHPWLAVDPWPALYAPGALNFSDICAHIDTQLRRRRPDAHYDIWYVFGSDNAGFADAFTHHGHAVCVTRPGHPAPPAHRRLVIAAGEHPANSTSIRVRSTPPAPPRGVQVLRCDLHQALAHLEVDHDVITATETALTGVLADASAVALRTVHQHELDAAAQRLSAGHPVVSLDTVIRGDAQLELSRRFRLDGTQLHAGELAERPGRPDVDTQLAAVAAALEGRACVVIDDDTATGATLTWATRALERAGVTVAHTGTLIDDQLVGAPIADVIDARDFIVGAAHGGLVVDTAAGPTRVPYLAPYVALWTRALLRTGTSTTTSARLWDLNATLHRHTGLRVGDLPDGLCALLAGDGWAPHQLVTDLCAATRDALLR